MSKDLAPISETEMEVLKVLWDHTGATVRTVNDRLPKWAYTTVQTLLGRLVEKGYVAKDASRFAHTYRPAVSRKMLLKRRLADLTRQLCDGAAESLVLALVENHRFSNDEIDRFRKVLDQLEAERAARGRAAGSKKRSRKPSRKEPRRKGSHE